MRFVLILNKMKFRKSNRYELGKHRFSEEEIIAFAQRLDPLPFHTDSQKAKESRFRGLVTSGSHAFMHFYPKAWIPLFGDSVIAGLEVSKWQFKAPIYANETIHAYCKILDVQKISSANEAVLTWRFSFKNVKSIEVQCLRIKILHKII